MVLEPTTLALRTASGDQLNVAAFTDGITTFVAHAAADGGGNLMGLAQDATLLSMTNAIEALLQALNAQASGGSVPVPVVSTDVGGIWIADDGSAIGLQ